MVVDATLRFSDPNKARETAKYVKKLSREFDSHAFHKKKLSSANDVSLSGIVELEWKDLIVGHVLGQGGFSCVHQVEIRRQGKTLKCLRRKAVVTNGRDEKQHKLDALRKRELAVKAVRSYARNSDQRHQTSIISLVFEGKLLSKLNHKHIIKLYGYCGSGNVLSKQVESERHFLVLERLDGTLQERLSEWQATIKRQDNVLNKFLFKKRLVNANKNNIPSTLQRIKTVALGIAHAMEYLHSQCILYRDLKPQNIGFHADGRVVLFDFGIAKLMDSPLGTTSGGRQLTRQAGTFRFMAPENYLGEPYGLPSDAHAFGLLLWSTCAVQVPFQDLSKKDQLEKHVIQGKLRPSTCNLDLDDNNQVVKLMEACWDESPQKRPCFSQIVGVLQKVLATNETNNNTTIGKDSVTRTLLAQ